MQLRMQWAQRKGLMPPAHAGQAMMMGSTAPEFTGVLHVTQQYYALSSKVDRTEIAFFKKIFRRT